MHSRWRAIVTSTKRESQNHLYRKTASTKKERVKVGGKKKSNKNKEKEKK